MFSFGVIFKCRGVEIGGIEKIWVKIENDKRYGIKWDSKDKIWVKQSKVNDLG